MKQEEIYVPQHWRIGTAAIGERPSQSSSMSLEMRIKMHPEKGKNIQHNGPSASLFV